MNGDERTLCRFVKGKDKLRSEFTESIEVSILAEQVFLTCLNALCQLDFKIFLRKVKNINSVLSENFPFTHHYL